MSSRRKIGGHKAYITTLSDKIYQELQSSAPDTTRLKAWSKQLDNQLAVIGSLYDSLIDEIEDPDEINKIFIEKSTEEERICLLAAQISSTLDNEPKQFAGPRVETKLPTLKLPEFDGNLTNWDSFWDQFSASIDSRKDLNPVDKLTYLRGALKGEVRKLIDGFSIEDDSYQSAVQLLKTTYDNPKRKQHELAMQLLQLKSPTHASNSLAEFRANLECTIRKLDNLGCNSNGSSWLISPLVMKKLPSKTIEMIQQITKEDYPQLQEIRDSLLKVINHLESKGPEVKADQNIRSVSVKDKSDKFKSSPKSLTNIYHTTEQSSSPLPPSNNAQARRTAPANDQPARPLRCILCEGAHLAKSCDKFSDRSERVRRLEQLGRCSRCTCNHRTEQCNFNLRRCDICKKGFHHQVLCDKSCKVNSQICSVTPSNNHNISTALPVGAVHVIKNKSQIKAKVLYDQGSQRTFISQDLVDKLNLKPIGKINLQLSGFLSEDVRKEYPLVKVTVKTGRKYTRLVAVVKDNLPSNLRTDGLEKCLTYLKQQGIKLSDPDMTDHIGKIDLLIGADYYPKLVHGLVKLKGVNFLQVQGGLVVYGDLPTKFVNPHPEVQVAMVTNVGLNPSFNLEEPDISNLWKMDSIGIKPEQITHEEAYVLENYKKTVQYNDDQYWVKLPWKVNRPNLPTNYKLALNRLNSNIKKLKGQGDLLEKYDQLIKGHLEKGFIEEVSDAEVSQNTHYIPHLAVIKDSKTTPLRIVFDCSAKLGSHTNSLNDCLYTGPTLSKKLLDVLLKFRTNEYAFTADISKAFLRIGLQEEDRDFTRFLWKQNPYDEHSPLVTYRFKSVLFGATSSPFLLQMTLNYHLDQQKENVEVSKQIKESLYMDNLQGTVNKEEDLKKFYLAANKIMQEANMPLQEWTCNSSTINSESEASNKILGLWWDPELDVLNVKDVRWDVVDSKRSLFSNISKIFDPLGLISPLTIPLKLLIQQTWTRKLGWDDTLPIDLQDSWENLSKECNNLANIKIPRMVVKEGSSYDLHLCCDASPKAYGVVAYISNYEDTPIILSSKARVAPLKGKTLPQLELTAMYVAVHYGKYIRDTLSNINFNNTYIWSDSEVALQWVVNNRSNILYVKNRVQEMINTDPHCHYHHLATKDNPADLLTRGLTYDKFVNNDSWFHGPEWLNNRDLWPEQKFKTNVEPNELTVLEIQENGDKPLLDPERFNCWNKLIKVTSLVFQFIHKIKGNKTLKSIKPQQYWLTYLQNSSFPEVRQYFKKPQVTKVPDLVKNLNLFEHNELIRCRGRLDHADLPYHTKFPLLLPRHHHLTKLLILHAHQTTLHGGVSDTLCKIRENFWIPKGRQVVKSTIKSCYICKRLEGRPYQYPSPPPLPKERVEEARPFEIIGIDYTGFIEILNPDTKQEQKVYVVLFTCAVTRAVHLELVTNLTAATFLNAFRRFVSRRSCPKLIISDNASNFKLGSELLDQILRSVEVQDEFNRRECEWRFIPPRAPWFGGFYERLIGVVKGCLKKILFRKPVDMDDLHTIITEVECRVNNRPLTYVLNSLDEPESLTPSHLLCGYRLDSLPSITTAPYDLDPSYMDVDKLNTKYHKLSKLINKWQDSWRTQYLSSLLDRHVPHKQAHKVNMKIKEGDVVLIHTDKSRDNWPLGIVQECYPDKSGTVRTVKVKSTHGTMIRTINKLYPLETATSSCPEELNSALGDITRDSPEAELVNTKRPHRRAAQNFRARLGEMIKGGDV